MTCTTKHVSSSSSLLSTLQYQGDHILSTRLSHALYYQGLAQSFRICISLCPGDHTLLLLLVLHYDNLRAYTYASLCLGARVLLLRQNYIGLVYILPCVGTGRMYRCRSMYCSSCRLKTTLNYNSVFCVWLSPYPSTNKK